MADRMTGADLANVADRIVETPAVAREPAAVSHEDILALKLRALAQAGDSGGVRRLVHDLQHGLSAWHADPWVLIAAMSGLAIRQLHG